MVKEKELRRSLAVLPIGTVMKLTNLTARQIRYYEAQALVFPERNDGNRRMYSLNDVDRLLEIKDYLADGINIAGIKAIYDQQHQAAQQKCSGSATAIDGRRRAANLARRVHSSRWAGPSNARNTATAAALRY